MRTSVDVSAFHRSPSPDAATGSAALGTSLPDRALTTISWSFSRRARRGDGQGAGDVVERAVGQAPRAAVELRQPADPPVRRGVGGDDEQLGGGPVDEAGPDVDERADHLGDPAAVVVRLDERLGVGAGQAGADDPGAEDDHRPGERPPPGG